MKDNKPWYEKIYIWIGIIAGICTILAFIITLCTINNNTIETNNNTTKDNDNIQDNVQVVGNDNITINGNVSGDININTNDLLETKASSESGATESEMENQFNFGQAMQHIYDNEESLQKEIINNENNKPINSSIYPGVNYWYIFDQVRLIVVTNGFRDNECSRTYYFDEKEKLTFALIKDDIGEHRLYFYNDILIRYIDENGQNHDINQDLNNYKCKWTDLALKESYEIFSGVKKPSKTDVNSVTNFDDENTQLNKLVVPLNPVTHDIQIILSVDSNSCPEEEIEIYNNDKEKELLYKAKELCENKKYDEAITIYKCDELKANPYAQVNIGYLYAHGYGYDENVETTLKIYDSIDMDIAKRNKLALLITSNMDGKNDAEIKNLIDYFIDKNDYYVQNYITNCLYSKNVEALNDREKNILCDLKELYVLELTGTINSTKTYSLNHAYKKLIYTGLSYNWNENHTMSAYYHYDVYQYRYLDWLEKIYA